MRNLISKQGSKVLFPGALPLASAGVGGFGWFRSYLDGSSTNFLLIFGRRPDFLDHSLAFVSRLRDVERAET